MRAGKAMLALAAVLSGIAASGPAMAHGHGRVHFGVFVGGPVFWPGYYYYPPPYYYYPPAVAVPYSPPVYIERESAPPAPAPAQPQGYWYYCAETKSYYPYVNQCPGGWQKVSPQPPS